MLWGCIIGYYSFGVLLTIGATYYNRVFCFAEGACFDRFKTRLADLCITCVNGVRRMRPRSTQGNYYDDSTEEERKHLVDECHL